MPTSAVLPVLVPCWKVRERDSDARGGEVLIPGEEVDVIPVNISGVDKLLCQGLSISGVER